MAASNVGIDDLYANMFDFEQTHCQPSKSVDSKATAAVNAIVSGYVGTGDAQKATVSFDEEMQLARALSESAADASVMTDDSKDMLSDQKHGGKFSHAAAASAATAATPALEATAAPPTATAAPYRPMSSFARPRSRKATATASASGSQKQSLDKKDTKEKAAGDGDTVVLDDADRTYPDHTERDRLALLNSRVFAEETAQEKPHWDISALIPNDSTWLTDNNLTCGIIHQVELSRRAGIPVKWPASKSVQVLYACNMQTIMNMARSPKGVLSEVAKVSNKLLIIPLGVGQKKSGVITTSHWTLLVIDSIRRLITYWDPFGADMPRELRVSLKCKYPTFIMHVCPEAVQTDWFQCGVYVVYGAACYYYDSSMMKETIDGGYRFSVVNHPFSTDGDVNNTPKDMRFVPQSKHAAMAAINSRLIARYRKSISARMVLDFQKGELTDAFMFTR